ncbi:MAG: adenylyl-sulfate kinase [Candidatus Obscuribacterales bacterium]|nr:adenylyl-sulfate kinase [Candidatus Obscuribacterales bacterium]
MLQLSSEKSLQVVVAGHIDHGKSTLLGTLLLRCSAVPEDKVAFLEALCAQRNEKLQPAFLLDAFQDEHDEGITIDTTHVTVKAKGHLLHLIDVPGHLQLIGNMTTGASHASVAALVVDAESGAEAQTECHMRILALMGVIPVVLVINKIDRVGFSQERYCWLTENLARRLNRNGLTLVASIPVSALDGDNVAELSSRTPWYSGPPVIDALIQSKEVKIDQQRETGPEPLEPFRLLVQDVYEFNDERVAVGKVISGAVSAGESVCMMPSGACTVIEKFIEIDGTAHRGDAVAFLMRDSSRVARGQVVSRVDQAATAISDASALALWLSRSDFCDGGQYRLKVGTQECPVEVRAQVAGTEVVRTGDVFEIQISSSSPVVFEAKTPELSNFVLCSDHETVAAGRFTAAITPGETNLPSAEQGLVMRNEREHRQNHKGFVLWLTGLPSAGKSTIARTTERKLFELGKNVVVLDADNVRQGLCCDLGFSEADRLENVRRIAHTADIMLKAGMIVIVSCISPSAKSRTIARSIIGRDFHEVFVQCPVSFCDERDPKGLYKRARKNEIASFTGVSSPYEPPSSPQLVLNTASYSLEESARQLLEYVRAIEMALS